MLYNTTIKQKQLFSKYNIYFLFFLRRILISFIFSKFIPAKWGYLWPDQKDRDFWSEQISGIPILASMILAPFLGRLVDAVGKRPYFRKYRSKKHIWVYNFCLSWFYWIRYN